MTVFRSCFSLSTCTMGRIVSVIMSRWEYFIFAIVDAETTLRFSQLWM